MCLDMGVLDQRHMSTMVRMDKDKSTLGCIPVMAATPWHLAGHITNSLGIVQTRRPRYPLQCADSVRGEAHPREYKQVVPMAPPAPQSHRMVSEVRVEAAKSMVRQAYWDEGMRGQNLNLD